MKATTCTRRPRVGEGGERQAEQWLDALGGSSAQMAGGR